MRRASSPTLRRPKLAASSPASSWCEPYPKPQKERRILMLNRRLAFFGACLAIAALTASPAPAQDKSIIVASTTSTQDSGLFGHILPLFKAKTGIEVRVVAQGTGQALDTGRRGDADVLFVHAKAQEEKFVADGFGVDRKSVV